MVRRWCPAVFGLFVLLCAFQLSKADAAFRVDESAIRVLLDDKEPRVSLVGAHRRPARSLRGTMIEQMLDAGCRMLFAASTGIRHLTSVDGGEAMRLTEMVSCAG